MYVQSVLLGGSLYDNLINPEVAEVLPVGSNMSKWEVEMDTVMSTNSMTPSKKSTKKRPQAAPHRVLTSEAVMEIKRQEREEKQRKENIKEENRKKREAKREETRAKRAKKEAEKKRKANSRCNDNTSNFNKGVCIICLMGGEGMLSCFRCLKPMHMHCVPAAHQTTMHTSIHSQIPFACHFCTFVY